MIFRTTDMSLNTEKLERRVRGIVASHVGKPGEAVSLSDPLSKHVGNDWLDQAELLIKVEDIFGFQLSQREPIRISTVGDLFELVQKHAPLT